MAKSVDDSMTTREISSAVEDYAKAIYSLEQRARAAPSTTNALAERLGVTAASASAMVKKLDGLGPRHATCPTAACS